MMYLLTASAFLMSLSARRAWIEIKDIDRPEQTKNVALRKESVDRNKGYRPARTNKEQSLSARRAWIEIKSGLQPLIASLVALRKESVDRNLAWHCMSEDVSVALRKESVDRNYPPEKPLEIGEKSLSARRAWIEMIMETPWRYLI